MYVLTPMLIICRQPGLTSCSLVIPVRIYSCYASRIDLTFLSLYRLVSARLSRNGGRQSLTWARTLGIKDSFASYQVTSKYGLPVLERAGTPSTKSIKSKLQ